MSRTKKVNPPLDLHEWISFEDDTTQRTWVFDATFLRSNWNCIFGNGCQGVLDGDASHLAQGCCSYGAHFIDDDDVQTVVESSKHLKKRHWQFKKEGTRDGILETVDGVTTTRLVDDACIFLNRPGFAGGVGCALHLAALELGERPIDWKPLVCWQAPVKASESTADDGTAVVTVRSWRRDDWGSGGATMAWCCTEPADRATFDSFTGDRLVVDSLQVELTELAGDAVWATLRAAVRGPSEGR